jgi:hypothetical protein
MSFLRSPGQAGVVPQYTGLQLQTSSGVVPITISYGATKIAPNAIWTGLFQIIPQGGAGPGGKGGLFGGNATSYNYDAALILALCEGPIVAVECIWNGSTLSDLNNLGGGVGLFRGTTPQSPVGFIQDLFPSQALGYPGTAFIQSENFPLGSSASIGSFQFEVYGVLAQSGFNGVDADPALLILDFLTNPQYGVGFPESSLDLATLLGASGDASYQTYCRAVGLALSPALINQQAANSTLTRWLQLTNTAAVWSGGQLKFIPYGDTQTTGNTVTYPGGVAVSFEVDQANNTTFVVQNPTVVSGTYTFNPNVTPIYNLTDDDFVAANGEDPVKVLRVDPYAAYNYQVLEIFQRTNYYDSTPIIAFDQSYIDAYGLRIGSTVTANDICDANVAQTVAQLILQRGLYIRNTYKWELSWEYCLLEPMDLVALTDPGIGLNNTVVRITEIDEADDGMLSFTAEEFPGDVATAVAYPVQSKTSSTVASNVDPGNINPPILFEPPFQLANGLAVWAAVSGANPQTWGGANVYISVDDQTYKLAGKVAGSSVMGATTADLPAIANAAMGQTIDATHTLAVDLTQSVGTLTSVSSAVMTALGSPCFVGTGGNFEIVTFENADLTAPNTYGLTPLVRGAFGTAIADHPAGSRFAELTETIFEYVYLASQIGATIYFKFQSFNTFGAGTQDLSQIPAYQYTITGSPLAEPMANVTGLATVFVGGFMQLSWDPVTDFRTGIRYKIFFGETFVGAQQVGDVAHPPFTLLGDGTYWIIAYCQPAVGIIAQSAEPTSIAVSGTLLPANIVETFNFAPAGFPGTYTSGLTLEGTAPNQFLQLAAGTPSGTYTSSEIFDLGYAGQLSIKASWQAGGTATSDNILASGNVLADQDLLDAAAAQSVTSFLQIAVAGPAVVNDIFAPPDAFDVPDIFTTPNVTAFGNWQNFVPGVYAGQFASFRVNLGCSNPNVNAQLDTLTITISVPARIDHYQNLSVPSGGLTITFTPDGTSTPAPFNGGPNGATLPMFSAPQWLQQPGDTYQITALTASSLKLQILNGGAGVARTGVAISVEGF